MSRWAVNLGFPEEIALKMERNIGISDLYGWQKKCLSLQSLISRKNLLYNLPTSGGKTLVADVLIMKEILLSNKSALMILPFVSIVEEKVITFATLALELGFWVEQYSGTKGIFPPIKRKKKQTLYIATIEKGLSLVNSLIEENRLSEIGIVVVDEIHYVGENSRGACLENLLIKFLHANTFIIGMSATVGNLPALASFLRAEIFSSNFRPVELNEFVKIEDELFSIDYKLDEIIKFDKTIPKEGDARINKIDADCVFSLVEGVVPDDCCLIFCATKKSCESLAMLITEVMKIKDESRKATYIEKNESERKSLIKGLFSEYEEKNSILSKTIPFGVAYHHSGLTSTERMLIENAFKNKVLCIICCTSTLAAGVNLPAKRVIIRSPYIGAQLVNFSQYKQMVGRAGRTGYYTTGESFLMCSGKDAPKVATMLKSEYDNCVSQLKGVHINNFILSLIHLRLANSFKDILSFLDLSFRCYDENFDLYQFKNSAELAIGKLIEIKAIKTVNNLIQLTDFGRGIAKANINVDDSLVLLNLLNRSREKLLLTDELHLIFNIAPSNQKVMTMEMITCVFSRMKPHQFPVAHIIGISNANIQRIVLGGMPQDKEDTVQKFVNAILIHHLVVYRSLVKTVRKYGVERGMLTNLLSSTISYTSAVIRFCNEIPELWCFSKLFSDFPEKLKLCHDPNLLPLMELPFVHRGRARQLYAKGIKTVKDVALSDPIHLSRIIDRLYHKQAIKMVNAAKLSLRSTFEKLCEEAEGYNLH